MPVLCSSKVSCLPRDHWDNLRRWFLVFLTRLASSLRVLFSMPRTSPVTMRPASCACMKSATLRVVWWLALCKAESVMASMRLRFALSLRQRFEPLTQRDSFS